MDPKDKKLAFVIIDMQKKFILEHEDIRKERLEPIERMNEIAALFREAGRPVIHVRFVGNETHRTYDGPDGDDIVPEIVVGPGDIIVDKGHMNSFKETDLAERIKACGCDGILVAGTVTQYCVISTYYGAFDCDLTPYMASCACITSQWECNDAAKTLCKDMDVEDVKDYLAGRPLKGCPQYKAHRGRYGRDSGG